MLGSIPLPAAETVELVVVFALVTVVLLLLIPFVGRMVGYLFTAIAVVYLFRRVTDV
ncbi:hypothetical protein [Natronorubrum texcoconense]|uniref:Uncharacterized protein n=1 Tax=Natronorubrum texcoconense TaxID=1095776 RepID=A0A1G9GWX9_9EURY|nr:hypothetical protein [Natronorubrum texcoconense]SDL04763.1 hypothetical protein SAMN04515672_0030 [Natronorubrum texcoconense]